MLCYSSGSYSTVIINGQVIRWVPFQTCVLSCRTFVLTLCTAGNSS